MPTTNVLGRDIPIRDGPKSIVSFSSGARGPQEAGRYALWTAILKADRDGVVRGYTIRSLESLPPGARYDRHPDDPRYHDMREGLKDCAYITPASVAEIESWLQGHRKDAAFASEAEVGGAKYRIEGLRLVPVNP